MNNFKFSSTVHPQYNELLEKLIFFNYHQSLYEAEIVRAIEKYGELRIVTGEQGLSIKLGAQFDSQCIFASYGPILIGVLVYAKNTLENNVHVIHIAVAEEYSSRGKYARMQALTKMIDHLKDTVRKIKGINTITLEYGMGKHKVSIPL
jgi:hypothetical protein